MQSHPLLLLCAATLSLPLFAGDAPAASFILADLSTAAVLPGSTAVSQSQVSRNLNNRTGLTPGAPILITVRSTDPFAWAGSLNYNPGTLTISIAATLSLIIGADTASTTVSVVNIFPDIVEGSDGTPVSGFLRSSSVFEFSLVVPWEADLTTAVFSLSQNSTLTGTSAGTFAASTVMAAGQSVGPVNIETSSIPEPKSSAFLLAALTLCSLRLSARRIPSPI